MSFFGKLLRGAARSTTIQANGGFLAILGVLMQSDLFNSIVAANPQYAAIALGIQSVINLLLRAKTDKALSER